MSRHLERLLQIDALLRSGQRQTVVSLAEALEVSDRTIRNDLAFLRDRFNAPIKFSRKKGHYYSDAEWRLPSISLSHGELFALTLGARMLIFQSEVGGKPVPVTIWFDASTAPYVRERPWHPTQEIQEHPDGSLTLHLVVGGLNELKRWVLGYGKGAVVKEPPELVEMVQEEVEGMSWNYSHLSGASK